MGRPEAECTAIVDVRHLRELRARAIDAHRTQRPPYAIMPPDLVDEFLDRDRFLQVQPPWTGTGQGRVVFRNET